MFLKQADIIGRNRVTWRAIESSIIMSPSQCAIRYKLFRTSLSPEMRTCRVLAWMAQQRCGRPLTAGVAASTAGKVRPVPDKYAFQVTDKRTNEQTNRRTSSSVSFLLHVKYTVGPIVSYRVKPPLLRRGFKINFTNSIFIWFFLIIITIRRKTLEVRIVDAWGEKK